MTFDLDMWLLAHLHPVGQVQRSGHGSELSSRWRDSKTFAGYGCTLYTTLQVYGCLLSFLC